MASFKLVSSIVLCIMVVAPIASEARIMPCPDIESAIHPCLSYLEYGAPVPKICCEGLIQIYNASSYYDFERKHACLCIHFALEYIIDDVGVKCRAKSLPEKCGVDLHYEIGTSIDNCYK